MRSSGPASASGGCSHTSVWETSSMRPRTAAMRVQRLSVASRKLSRTYSALCCWGGGWYVGQQTEVSRAFVVFEG